MRKYFRRLAAHRGLFWAFLTIVTATAIFFRLFLPVAIFAKNNSLTPSFFFNLAFADKFPLKAWQERTNILVLGIPGGNHTGSDLTDTVLFLSFDQEKKKTFTISLPRDVWSDSLRDKINSAYHYGEEKRKGGGLILAKATVGEILNQPVHYAFVLDFSLFKEIINLLGGIDIYVERGFEDNRFPLPGREDDLCDGDPEYKCRYEHINFDAGWQKMDGLTALKFIRSRNAEGEEGTDFARIRRQQKVLEAIKNKILSLKTLSSPQVLIDLLNTIKEKSQSDANLGETLYLSKLFFNKGEENTISLEEQFINPPVWQYNGHWVLVPKEDWNSFHQFIKEELQEE